MARQARILVPGGLYHVISRGIERRDLFRDERDRNRYFALLEKAVGRFGCRILAYCLMDNHVHLALMAGKQPLPRIMRSINTAYAGYFNVRHRRSGYLFQGRYKAFLVDEEAYLLALVRYIHENPVKAGIVARAEEYSWSSHASYLGRPPSWLATDEVLQRFGTKRSAALREFRRFFLEPEEEPYAELKPRVQAIVGSESFAKDALERAPVETALTVKSTSAREIVSWVAREEGVSVSDLRGPSRKRTLSAVRTLCGYLAPHVGISTARMARELRRSQPNLWKNVETLSRSADKDPLLGKRLARLRDELVAHVNNI